MYMFVCMHVCMYMYMYMYVCMYVYVYTCMYVCEYECIYLSIHLSIYIYLSKYISIYYIHVISIFNLLIYLSFSLTTVYNLSFYIYLFYLKYIHKRTLLANFLLRARLFISTDIPYQKKKNIPHYTFFASSPLQNLSISIFLLMPNNHHNKGRYIPDQHRRRELYGFNLGLWDNLNYLF